MTISVGAAILAAGQGTRMKLDVPKPLAPAAGKVLVDFSIEAIKEFYKQCSVEGEITLVTGHQRELVSDYINQNYPDELSTLKFAVQERQLGTADALRSYYEGNPHAKEFDYTIVMCADTPMIRGVDLALLYDHISKNELDGVAATFIDKNPTGYGRIIRGENGFHIVEEKDASEDERKVTEVNSGLYILKTSFVLENLYNIDSNNKGGEFYLTSLFQDQFKVSPIVFDDGDKFVGVNTLEQLEYVGSLLRSEKNASLRASGVRFIDSSTCYIDWDVTIGEQSVIYPNVILEGKSSIGAKVKIGAGSVIVNSTVESCVELLPYSCLENSVVRSGAAIGPFARLRPGADIGEEAKIGNFVEVKKATLHSGAKVSHLSYVGDAEIGSNTNIGCGFITCNYDGANKHKTTIGADSFIGAGCQAVAPINIGDKCFVATGSTVTSSLKDGDFAISRGKQQTKEGMARRFIKTKKK